MAKVQLDASTKLCDIERNVGRLPLLNCSIYIDTDRRYLIPHRGGSLYSYEELGFMLECLHNYYRSTSQEQIDKASLLSWDDQYTRDEGSKNVRPINRFSPGYVYFIQNSNGHTKIGCTINIKNRLSALQSSSPDRLALIHSIKVFDMRTVEISIHKEFHGKKISGEWFSLNEDDIEKVGNYKDIDEEAYGKLNHPNR